MRTPETYPADTPEELIDDLLSFLELKVHRLYLSDDEIARFLGLRFPTKADFDAVLPSLIEEGKQRSQRDLRTRLEESVREKLISDWVESNVNTKRDDKEGLKREIDLYVKERRMEDLRVYLSDVLEVGLKKAQSRRTRKLWGDVRHVWEGLTGLVRVAIVLGIFGAAQTKFETIVFAMLVMIYHAIYGTSSECLQIIHGVASGVDNQFKRIRRVLNAEATPADRGLEYEREQKLLKDATRREVRFTIRSVFLSVIWWIAIWKLVAVVYF